MNREQIIAIRGFAARREVRGAAIDHGIIAVQAADHELVVNLVAGKARHLVERRRQGHLARLAGDLNPGRLPGRVEENTLRGVRDTVAEHGLCRVKLTQRLADRARTHGNLHHREDDIAFGRMRFLQDAIRHAAQNFGHIGVGMRRKRNLHFRHEIGLGLIGLRREAGAAERIGRALARRFVAAQHLPAFLENLVIVAGHVGVLEHQDVIGVHVKSGQGEVRGAGEDLDGRLSAP